MQLKINFGFQTEATFVKALCFYEYYEDAVLQENHLSHRYKIFQWLGYILHKENASKLLLKARKPRKIIKIL